MLYYTTSHQYVVGETIDLCVYRLLGSALFCAGAYLYGYWKTLALSALLLKLYVMEKGIKQQTNIPNK